MLKSPFIYPLCLGMAATTGCHQNNENAKTTHTPNIIILLADDMGYNDASAYRNLNAPVSDQPPTSVTSAIDSLAANGMLFTDFYCGAAVCSPSRAVMLTGRNATRLGIYNWIPSNSPMHLRSSEITLAEMLKRKDYHTAHFGKWHLTSENRDDQPRPNDQGYDYSFFAYNNARPSHANPENYFRNGQAVGELEGYACQLIVDEAMGWLDTLESGNPFYINIWFNEPHTKLAAPDSLTEKHTYHKKYYGAIENMDIAIGRVMQYLREKQLEDNTIVIFSSDNGSQWPASNDPLRGEKCFNFDGGVRVPFVVKWPGKIPRGKVNYTNGSFADIFPTLAKITGALYPENITLDGEDISLALFEDSTYERKGSIFRYRYFHEPICMLRDGKWSLLGYENVIPYAENYNERELAKFKPAPGEPRWAQWGFQENHMEAIPDIVPVHFELYNLEVDPGQENDLSADYPEKVEDMKLTMLQLHEEMITEGGDWFK